MKIHIVHSPGIFLAVPSTSGYLGGFTRWKPQPPLCSVPLSDFKYTCKQNLYWTSSISDNAAINVCWGKVREEFGSKLALRTVRFVA